MEYTQADIDEREKQIHGTEDMIDDLKSQVRTLEKERQDVEYDFNSFKDNIKAPL